MRYHHTKNKGDLGVAKVIADLIDKGYGILLPMSEHLPYDVVAADDNGNLLKIQVKYRAGESVSLSAYTSWADKNGSHKAFYTSKDFDFFAVYSPEVDKVIYVPWCGEFKQMSIRVFTPNSATPYYWYEDFLDLNDSLPERRKHDTLPYIQHRNLSKNRKTKISWPSVEEVISMVQDTSFLQVGKDLGVSDNAVRKYLKRNGVNV